MAGKGYPVISGKIVEKLTNAPDNIVVKVFKCRRMRFYENRCSSCADICPSGAITLEMGPRINKEACTECMLCASACTSDGLSIDNSKFYATIAALKKVQSPVLGCTMKPGSKAHARTFCFGYMSEEHILALLYFMREPLQVNLTECGGCKNAFIAGTVEKRLQSVEEKSSLKVFEKIRLVRNKADLRYQDVSLDRRGFFEALKKSAFVGMAGLLDNNSEREKIQSYSGNKTAPSKREMLNKVFSGMDEEGRKELSSNYYYELTLDENCDGCVSCAAMCPTGALKVDTGESGDLGGEGEESGESGTCELAGGLLFNSSLCSGCGLCASFCESGSIRIGKGFTGTDPLQFSLKKSLTSETAEEEALSSAGDDAESKY